MATDAERLAILIEANTKSYENAMKRLEQKTDQAIKSAQRSIKQLDKSWTAAFDSIGRKAATFAAGYFTTATLKGILDTAANFQKLRASLETVTGSADKGKAAFAFIQDLATKTPFSVQQVTEAFIKLKSLGLDPSEKALRSYGNTAAAMGKSLDQVIEAVADAATGEFERLKEFGVKAKAQGDQIQFTFQGVTTTVKNSASDIERYLQQIGEQKFGDAMQKQMNTLGGAFSNLQDATAKFEDAIGEGGLATAVQKAATALSDFIDKNKGFAEFVGSTLAEPINALTTAFEALAAAGNTPGLKLIFDVLSAVNQLDERATQVLSAIVHNPNTTVADFAATNRVNQAFEVAGNPTTITGGSYSKSLADVPAQYRSAFVGAAAKYGVDPNLLASVAYRESGFNPSSTSPVGAQGMMQIMPGTASQYGVANPYDAQQAIEGGARILADLVKQFSGNIAAALVGYNWGPGHAADWLKSGAAFGSLPKETQDYLKAIMGPSLGMSTAPAATSTPLQVTIGTGTPTAPLPNPRPSTPVTPTDVDAIVVAQETADQALQDLIARMDEVRTTSKGMLSAFTDAIMNGASATDALKAALSSLVTKLVDVAENNVVEGLFGKSGSTGGNSIFGALLAGLSGNPTGQPVNLLAPSMHTGGVVGAGGLARPVPAAIFANAPRYHSGGYPGLQPGEVPAILQRGEIVIPRVGNMRASASRSGSDMGINVTVNGARGNMEVQAMVQAGVVQGLAQYDRALPKKLKNIQQR